MQTIFNQHGIAITYLENEILLWTLLSSSDNIELELSYKSEMEIIRIFEKDINDIEQLDMLECAVQKAN